MGGATRVFASCLESYAVEFVPEDRVAQGNKGDFRSLPQHAWQRIYDLFHSGSDLSTAEEPSSAEVFRDQEWENEEKGRWWYRNQLICYFCGDTDCHDEIDRCCERRRREVLGVEDESDGSAAEQESLAEKVDVPNLTIATSLLSGLRESSTPSSQHNVSSEALIEERKRILHSRVDCMMQLLERVVQTSLVVIPQEVISSILDKAKSAQQWQKESLSPEQLDDKIREIDEFMSDAVKHFR